MASLHPGPGHEVAIWMCPLPHPNICTVTSCHSSCHCYPPAASPVPSSPLFLNRHDSSFPTTELPNSFPRIQPKVLPHFTLDLGCSGQVSGSSNKTNWFQPQGLQKPYSFLNSESFHKELPSVCHLSQPGFAKHLIFIHNPLVLDLVNVKTLL